MGLVASLSISFKQNRYATLFNWHRNQGGEDRECKWRSKIPRHILNLAISDQR